MRRSTRCCVRRVEEIVRKQVECGVDVVCDGEISKTSFNVYIRHRLGGFEPSPEGAPIAMGRWGDTRETLAFPEYYAWYEKQRDDRKPIEEERTPLVCSSPRDLHGHGGPAARHR